MNELIGNDRNKMNIGLQNHDFMVDKKKKKKTCHNTKKTDNSLNNLIGNW